MASRKVASAYVDLQLQIAQFKAAIGEAGGLTKRFSAEMREEMEHSRESVKLLSEELGLGVPRGLQRIIAGLPGVTTAMNLAFDAVVVFALIKTVYEVGEKVVEFVHKTEEAAKKHDEAWKSVDRSLQSNIRSLIVQDDKIQASIDKLQHKPHNAMKDAIDEATKAAGELSDKLDEDIKKIQMNLQGQEAGIFQRALLNKADSSAENPISAEAILGRMQSTLDDIQTKRDAGIIQNWDADGQVTGALRNAKGELEASQKVFADLQVAHDTPSRIGVPLGLGAPDQAKNIQGVEDALNEVTKMNRAHDYTLKVGRDAGEEKDLSEKDRLSKEAKEAAARAKEAADKLYAAHLKTVAAADAAFNDNPAAIAANPKWLETQKRREGDSEPQQMKSWLDSQVALNGSDRAKGMSQAQADRITNTLLPELVKQGQERNTADDQRISEQTANAEKEYNAGETRLGVDSRKSFTEAMKTLSESADKAALSLTQAALEYETAIDKWQLSVGAMTEAEYQKRRMETISSTANVEKFDLQHKYDEQVQAANDKRDKTQTADQTLYDSMKDKYAQQYGGSALTYLVDTLYKKLAADFDTAQDRDRQEQNEAALSQDRGSQTLDVKTMTATFEALMAAHESTAIGAIDKVFDEFEARSNDLGKQVHEVLTEAINGVNDALVKMMTEQDHRGVWKDMGKSLFTGVAKTGLQDAEGFGMKALGLGTKVQHVIVDNHDQIGISSGNPLGSKSTGLLGWANNNNFMSSLFGGKLFGAGSIFGGGMANGGVLSPGDFYMTGEQGPELLQVGSTSKINNARDTSAMLSTGSGSGSPVHNWNIDARGATDPAATYQAAQRAIMAAAPHIVAASNAAQKDQSRRRPSSRS